MQSSVLQEIEITKLLIRLKKLEYPYYIMEIGQKQLHWGKQNGLNFLQRFTIRKR